MKTKIIVGFLTLTLLLIPTTASKAAGNPEVDLTIRVYAYREDMTPVKGSQVRIDIDPGIGSYTVDPPKEGNEYKFSQLVDEMEGIKTVTIMVEPPYGYDRRQIRLRRQVGETNEISRQVNIYLVETNTEVPFAALDGLRQDLDNGKVEKALALAEYAYKFTTHPDNVREYLVTVWFNYARAIQNACIRPRFGYDTCSQARELLKKLDSWYDQETYRRYFRGIEKETINDAIRDIDDYEQTQKERRILQSYSGIEEAFLRDRLESKEAARRIEKILFTYAANKDVWLKYGKPERDLHRDAGLAWLHYAQFLNSHPTLADDDLIAILTRSIFHFDQALYLGEPSPSTQDGREMAKSLHKRLSQTQAQSQ